VGLPADRPYLLYVCSSLFAARATRRSSWRSGSAAIRESADPALRSVGILIRRIRAGWTSGRTSTLSALGDVAFWGAHPVDKVAKDDYFDSMHYAAAVVGLNTSAFLEAAVLGKSVYTVMLSKYSKNNQEGTLHFRYLLEAGGGLLHTSTRFESTWPSSRSAWRSPMRRIRRAGVRRGVHPPAWPRHPGLAGLRRRD